MTSDDALSEAADALAQRLRRLRAEQGLSQREAAVACGMTRNHYSLLENGRSASGGAANPRLSTLLTVAETYGIEVINLLSDAR